MNIYFIELALSDYQLEPEINLKVIIYALFI
jgi:hypothetical protein